MKTTTTTIGSLLDRIERREIRLPEIQRAYVWKPAQTAGLIDSLYRRYPSGSLLLWETDSTVTEREIAADGAHAAPLTKPQYLLDGQQRLTSLYRVWSGDERARVVFNVETQKFQIESVATKQDRHWISVHELVRGKRSTFSAVEDLSAAGSGLSREEMHARLERVKKILDYPYFIEILENSPYEEVTEIFVRVNSKGRALRKVDLALATLSARWSGVVEKLEREAKKWRDQGYRHLDVSFLTRCLAALATDTARFDGFTSASEERLEDAWKRVERGTEHLVALLKQNARMPTSELLPSVNALVPLVAYLGSRDEQPLDAGRTNALVYWLFGAFVLGRYSQSADTVIAQDVSATRSDDPIKALYRNLGLLGGRIAITEQSLIGRGASSPYFLFSYLAARKAGATDWYHGVTLGAEDGGTFKLEYHHIHPRARLTKQYSRAEINDLANLAFISGKANRKISNRKPSDYFPELSEQELQRHFVPLDPTLREPESYRAFIRERRRLLAGAMTQLLENYRPPEFTSASEYVPDPAVGEALTISIYSSYPEASDGVAVFFAHSEEGSWKAAVPLEDFLTFVDDLDAGLTANLTVGPDTSLVEAGQEIVEVLVGPLRATGTLAEWRKVLDRELGEVLPRAEAPDLPPPAPWTGQRSFFPILDSE